MLTHSSFRLTDLSHHPSQQPIPSSTVHCHPRPPLLTHHVIHSSATHSSISTDACCRASSGAACHWLRDWSSHFSVSYPSPTYSAPSLSFRPLLVDVISTTPSRRQPFPIVLNPSSRLLLSLSVPPKVSPDPPDWGIRAPPPLAGRRVAVNFPRNLEPGVGPTGSGCPTVAPRQRSEPPTRVGPGWRAPSRYLHCLAAPLLGLFGSSAATRLSISPLTHRCPAVPSDLSEWRGHSVGWFSEEIPDPKGTVFSQGSNLEPCDSEIWHQPLSHSFQI